MEETSETLAARLTAALAQHANADAWRIAQARTLHTRCMVGIGGIALMLDIERGVLQGCRRGVPLLGEWCFALRGSCAAWQAYWEPTPQPGWHDLFALSRRAEMRFEGTLHPFIAHLQYFKDLLALPRMALS